MAEKNRVSSMETEEHGDGRPAKESKTTEVISESEKIVDQPETNDSKESASVEEKEQDTTETKKLSNDQETQQSCAEQIQFRVVWNKKNYEVTFGLEETADSLKQHIESLTGLPVSMQKLMFKGLVKDGSKTLRDLHVTKGAKMMVVGSTINDVLKVTPPPPSALKEEKASGPTKEPLSKQKMHRKVLDKGKPDDVIPGIKNRKESLPTVPLSGMYNKYGNKVRLTFKLEVDQVWLGTKERTEKLPMGSIKNIISEPIEGHEEYHMLALQLGPTEASRYWIYWVPAQYVDAIKDTVLGKWQAF